MKTFWDAGRVAAAALAALMSTGLAAAEVCDASAGAALLRRVPASISSIVHGLAPEYRIDPNLVFAMMATESGFQSSVVSPKDAQGLMQIIPETAQRFGVKDAFDPADNILGALKYIRWLLDEFKGDVSLMLAGYNAGEAAVVRHGGIPPYRETRQYVARIQRMLGCARFAAVEGAAPGPAPVAHRRQRTFQNPWEPLPRVSERRRWGGAR